MPGRTTGEVPYWLFFAGSVVLLLEPEPLAGWSVDEPLLLGEVPDAPPEAEPVAEPEPEADPEVLGGVLDAPPEAEPEPDGLAGVVALDDDEPELDGLVELEPLIPEDEPDPGERLVASLDEDDPALPVVASPPRSQP